MTDATEVDASELGVVVAACARLPTPWTVLIDGRSGAGKSTFADAVVAATGAELVRLDDLYPGWDGLERGVDQARRDLLEPRTRGAIGRWQRWDWHASRPAEWHTVPPAASLVLEGCGALWAGDLGTTARGPADLGVWIDLPTAERRRRARLRDGDRFGRHFDAWAAQEDLYLALAHPVERADLVLHGPARRTSGPR